jgi:hypothetical protein
MLSCTSVLGEILHFLIIFNNFQSDIYEQIIFKSIGQLIFN